MRWVVWVVLIGCGRVDFDPAHGSADAATDTAAPICGAWGGVQRLDALASAANDWDATRFGSLIVFSSDRTGTDRLYLGTTGNVLIREITELGDPAMYTLGPAWSPDGARLYFSMVQGAGYRLFESAYTGNAFAAPTLVPGLESTNADSPTFSADELEMFFDDGQTILDASTLYRAHRASTGDPWIVDGPVTELLSHTADGWPSLSADGLTLWFESGRDPLAGGIYTATRPDRGSPFGPVSRVGELDPTTSADDSGDPEIDPGGTQMLFAGHFAGSAGGDDLYLAMRTCR